MLGERIVDYCDMLRDTPRGPLLEAFTRRLELYGKAVISLEKEEEEWEVTIRKALGDADAAELEVLLEYGNKLYDRLGQLLNNENKKMGLE